MVYGELGATALAWATSSMFGLEPDRMPAHVVISPFAIEEFFEDFVTQVRDHGLAVQQLSSAFLVQGREERALFCRGGIGASVFADFSYVLCHCDKVKEVIFVGSGAGLGQAVNTADVHLPLSRLRLDRVLEDLLPRKLGAKATPRLLETLSGLIGPRLRALERSLHAGLHATVPFLHIETDPFLRKLERRGVLSVDRVRRSIRAANHYRKATAGIIRIGDLPLRGIPIWKSRDYQLDLKKKVHRAILQGLLEHLFG
jgi:purine-nucleoside phosphorylase